MFWIESPLNQRDFYVIFSLNQGYFEKIKTLGIPWSTEINHFQK